MRTDWLSIGVRFFSWIAGIALALTALLLFRGPAANIWLWATIGLVAGIALLRVGELRIARTYPATANAIDAAGICILSATPYAMHSRWALHVFDCSRGRNVHGCVGRDRYRPADRRVPAFALLLATIIKCPLNDVPHLGACLCSPRCSASAFRSS